MIKTLTARFDHADKARAAHRDLITLGIEREKLFLQDKHGILKVHTMRNTEAKIRAVLDRHEPNAITEFTP